MICNADNVYSESRSSSSRKTKQVKYCKKCQGTVSGPAACTLTLPIQQANRTDRGNGESHQCSPSSRHTEPHATGTWRKDVRHTSMEMNESQHKSEQHLVETTVPQTVRLRILRTLSVASIFPQVSVHFRYVFIIS